MAEDAAADGPGSAPPALAAPNRRGRKTEAAAAEATAAARIAAVVVLLRERGRVADRRARVFLWALLALVALGLGYYVLRPLAQTYFDGVRATWEDQFAVWSRQSATLDSQREELRDRLVTALSPAGIPVASGTEEYLGSLLHLPGTETVIAAGSGGAVTRSTDAGASWSPVASGTEEYLGSLLHLPGTETVIAAGSGGAVTRSTDAGASWGPVASGTEEDLGSLLHLPGTETVIAAGSGGAVTRSTDAGASWSPVASGTEEDLGSLLHLPGTETVIAAGSGGTVTRSTDAGASWSPVASGTEKDLGSLLHLPGTETLIAAGSGGAVTRSTDAGAIWSPVASGTEQNLRSLLHLPGTETLIAAGTSGAVVQIADQLADGLATLGTPLLPVVTSVTLEKSGATFQAERHVLPPGAVGDSLLGSWLDALPPGLAEFPTVAAEFPALDDIVSRRVPVQEALTTARNELEARRSGTATLADRQAIFEGFMAGCRRDGGPDDNGAVTKACAEAWAAAEREDTRDWWAVLAEQVPPGILLLFLLATLSALYRYNVRLAGFHHSRADALELLAAGAAVGNLTALADALAADKVEFGAAKTPTDHAAEMATALINRAKP